MRLKVRRSYRKDAIMELMKAVDETIPQPDRPKDDLS